MLMLTRLVNARYWLLYIYIYSQKFVEERKTRLEFFKKLQGYEIHKENVYII